MGSFSSTPSPALIICRLFNDGHSDQCEVPHEFLSSLHQHHRLYGHWVWANSGRWWRTGASGVLQSMRSQRVRYDWATEQQTAITSTKGLEVLILPHLSSPNCLLTCMCVYSWVLSNSSSTQIAWWYIWNVSIWATKQPSHSTADVSFWKTLQDAWTAVKNYIWFEALNSDMDP